MGICSWNRRGIPPAYTDNVLFQTKSTFRYHCSQQQVKDLTHRGKDSSQTKGLQCSSLTLPQALQWCRLSVRLKSEVQFMHIITWETGTSTGAASPRAIHNFSRACLDKVGMMYRCLTFTDNENKAVFFLSLHKKIYIASYC